MPEKLNNFDPTNLQELFSVEGPREETDASPVETIGSTTQNSKTTTPKENSTSKHKEHKKPKRQESKNWKQNCLITSADVERPIGTFLLLR